MITFPNCKINAGLWIIAKRSDGYHNIETVMLPAAWYDVLEIIPAAGRSSRITVTGLPVDGTADQNLCFKAWKLMQEQYGIPAVEMHLHKIVPMGTGLGGGSSDGAFALRMLNSMFGLKLETAALQQLATSLGMDCPFFITNQPSLATGRGEVLTPVSNPLTGYHLVIVKPPVQVNTAHAYSLIKPVKRAAQLKAEFDKPVGEWKQCLENDFEQVVFQENPEVEAIRNRLYSLGAVYAALSGSGSAVFGIFSERPGLPQFAGCQVHQSLLGSHY